MPGFQPFFRDFALDDFFCSAVDDCFRDFFFEPLKMRSQPFENFSVDPVWTVYPVIVSLSCWKSWKKRAVTTPGGCEPLGSTPDGRSLFNADRAKRRSSKVV